MTDRERFPLTPENAQILKHSCRAYSIAAERKFGCHVVVHNVDDSTASFTGSNKGSIAPEIKYSKQLPGGLKISVWKDDLTTHRADAVVNAANERLDHAGGLALALCQAGGPEIQQISHYLVQTNGLVPTGDAVLTTAGKLPCSYIIHAVGPRVDQNPSPRKIAAAIPLLEKAIWSIFQITEYNNLQSVAIPAISSGLFNFPRDTCADVIVNTVKSISKQRRPLAQSLEVRLVNNDDPSVQEMLRACQQFLGPPDSQSGVMQSQSMASTKPALCNLELGSVTLFLKQGHIEEETTDAIVNTIGADLDLSAGYVSKAILQKAGNGIQKEIIKRGSRHVPNDHVIETTSHNLKARAVFHTICAGKQSHLPTSQVLHKVITRCLEMTNERDFSSISFPAIGTGNLGLRKEEVSQKMISAVVDFAKSYHGRKKNVYFVIFPADTDKYEAFRKEMASVERKTSKAFSNADKSSVFHTHEEARETTPYIEFLADSCEAVREAKQWTVRMLHIPSGLITIQNNHVIQFGQEDHAKLMSLQTIFDVSITESFRDGKCGITIKGGSTGLSHAALEVEAMLCQAQEDFAQAEENDLLHSVVCWRAFPGSEEPEINAALEKAYLAKKDTFDLTVNLTGQKITVDFRQMLMKSETGRGLVDRISFFSLYTKLPELNSKSYYERITITLKSDGQRKAKFNKYGLNIVKVEKIENNALKQVFGLNKKRVQGQPQQLYQRVTAQFCELISRVGFQRDYAPPKEQKWGAGIYFTSELGNATRLWQDSEEEYIYIIEAQVLTGDCTRGSSQLIVPPPTEAVPQLHYDSVCNNTKDTFVIFNGQQALPTFIYTCIKTTH